MKYLICLIPAMALLLVSCKEDEKTHYWENIVVNECSSEVRVITGNLKVNEDNNGEEYIYVPTDCAKYTLEKGGNFSEVVTMESVMGSVMTVDSLPSIGNHSDLLAVGDSVLFFPHGDARYYATDLFDEMWKLGFFANGECDFLETKGNTIRRTFILNDERIEEIWESLIRKNGKCPQKVVFEE